VADRLAGAWEPTEASFLALLSPESGETDLSRPYPFFLASQLEQPVASLGPREEWLAEWKWDGIRAQLLRRAGRIHLWSRGEELVTDRFPEIVRAAGALPDGVVLDGEVTAWRGEAPLPFSVLQTRIGRQTLTPRALAAAPVLFLAYDLLEEEGRDLRELPLAERRGRLERLLEGRSDRLALSPGLSDPTWDELARRRLEARSRNVEGLILKRLASPYRSGRKRGEGGARASSPT
jgi:DNA ligase-1